MILPMRSLLTVGNSIIAGMLRQISYPVNYRRRWSGDAAPEVVVFIGKACPREVARLVYRNMTYQFSGVLFMGLALFVSSGAEPIEDSKEAPPKGIPVEAGTRLRVVCYNGYWTSIFPRDEGEVRSSEWMLNTPYSPRSEVK